MKRLHLLPHVLALALAATFGGAAQADTYPSKPIRLIVGFAPGGGGDVTARLIGPRLSEALGQNIIVDNRPGAGGTIGAAATARAPNDGYTLLMTTNGPHAMAPHLYPALPYDIFKDFAPIGMVIVTPYVLVSHPSVEANNLQQLLTWLRSRPAPEAYASAGSGTPAHLGGVLLASMANVKLNHVPYKGAAPALTAVLGGEVPLVFSEISVSAAHIRAKRIKAYGVASPRRNPLLPEVPTMGEGGLSGYELTSWQALMAPAGTPPEIIQRLNTETNKVLALPEIREKFAALGAVLSFGTPADLTAAMKSETERWGKVIRGAGIKLE